MRHRYPQPGNEDEFEDFCVRFYCHLLKRSTLVRYAKRGENQDGIDIIDQLGLKPFIAIQCKQHEPTKTIPPKEIRHEVAQAESSPHPVAHYIIATTAKKSRNAQDTVLQLNQRNEESRPFTVEIHFWEDICTHLSQFGRAVADFIVFGESSIEEQLEPVQFRAGSYASVAADSTYESEDAELYPQIDALFEERKLEAAEHEISKLPDPERDATLDAHRQYAILRLKAKLALERSQFAEGVRLFNLAYETLPELQQARQNRVLALQFSGEQKEAFAEAEKLLDDGVRSSFLVSMLIRSSSIPADLLPHQDSINEYVSSGEDVNLALADKHLAWDQFDLAEEAARRALNVAPESAHAHMACAMVAHASALQGVWQNRYKRLADAIHHYSEAITAADRDNYSGLLPEIYTNRGRVNAVVGDRDQAAQDFRSAVRVSDTPSLYAEAAVSFFLNVLDFDSALELASLLDATSEEAAFLTAVTEYHHASDDEKRNYIVALQSLADRGIPRATDARCHCVQWAIDLNDFELARQCVPESFVEQQPFQGNTLLAWIELETGNEEEARSAAALAFDSSALAANQQDISVLASLLTRLGEDEQALPLLEQAATPGVLDDDCKRLVQCAQRLNRHDTLIRVCAELRATNQQDNLIRRLEVQLLSNYSPDQAFALAKDFVRYDQSYFAAARNFLAVRLGKMEEIEFDDDNLPTPDDFDTEESYLVVTPYIEVGRHRDALEFAYHQLRKRFSEERAHGQYIWFVLQYGEKAEIPRSPTVVDRQSAVRLENLTTGEHRWFIIEDCQPDPARNEYSSSTSVVEALIGKQVGDAVHLRGPSLQPQQERVLEVQSKYVRLFQDAISNFQRRFPGAGTIQSLHMGGEENFDPSPLIERGEARRQLVADAMAFYHSSLCSLNLLAFRLGIDERQLMTDLGANDEWFVRCVECVPRQFSEIAEAGFDTNKVVLDLSAIITISRLNAWDQLDPELELLVSRATSDRTAQWLHNLTKTDCRPSAYTYLSDDGTLTVQEVTAEQQQNERDEVQNIATRVGKLAAVQSSLALATLDPQRREQYIEACGLGSLESVSLAREENALLWTDDLFVGVLAEVDFGVKRIWTQLVFKVLENVARIDSDTYNEITAKLAAWNYMSTVWNPRDVIAAGNLCDWDANQWPLKQCIRLIGSCPLPLPQKASLAMEFLRLLRRSTCIELKQTPVVQAVLDSLGNSSAVEWMLQRLDQVFRIDVSSAEFLKFELSYWLRLR